MHLVQKLGTWSLSCALTLAVPAAGASKEGRLSGNVLEVEKTQITLEKGTAHRIVEVTPATSFTMAASPKNPASAEQVQRGNYVTCVGTWDGVKLAASRRSVSPSKRP